MALILGTLDFKELKEWLSKTNSMFKNYLITALRNLKREKTSTVINIAGLSLGIASSLILFLMVKHHFGFDTHHVNRDRIYRVVTESDGNQGRNYQPGVPTVLPEAFEQDFPEAESVTFIANRSGSMVTIPQPTAEPKKYEEERGITYAQPSFFKIFDRKILMGDPAKSLDEPNEAVISRKLAMKYFGKENVLGEMVRFDNKEYQVKAVMEDYPSQTDFPFDLMLSYITIKKERDEVGWRGIWSEEQCYFTLRPGHNIAEIESRIPAFIKKYHEKEDPHHETFVMQPLSEIHFDDRYSNYSNNTVSRQMLMALSIIALFLVLTACINFVNLTTAEAIKRSKEVGIRKSLGSTRGELIRQFLGETTLVTVLSVVLALGMAQLALGFLNPFLEISLTLNFVSDWQLWVFLLGLTLIVSLLSGLYPSLVVSAFKPALALKNLINSKNSSGYALRRGLVVVQFFISQFFIIGTIVLINQMNYFRSKDLGFSRDAIINIPIPEAENPAGKTGSSKMRTLRNEVELLTGVEISSLNNTPPSSSSTSNTNFTIEGNANDFGTQLKLVDSNYIGLYKLDLVAGANVLDLDTAQGFMVNERLAAMTGYNDPHDIIGKRIKMWGKELPVVGVVRNFHTVSLRDPIEATIMQNRIRNYENLSIKLNPQSMKETISKIREKWEATYPAYVFSYEFLDDQIREFYESEERMSVLLGLFTSMAIFIGCLGLFGLATFMANQKTKEIGVRKVLGASVRSIVLMFSKEYIRLILIGFALAAPVTWYVMNQWLNEFAYKIEIGPSIFMEGIVLTLTVALLTVGYRSFRAAVINPTESLRSE